MEETRLCPCGQPLHYTNPDLRDLVDQFVKDLGPDVKVTAGYRAWMVPRHYVALHGVKAEELPALAARYGWKEVL